MVRGLSIFAGLSIAGGALGLLLGQAAIGEIDFAQFSTPETSFHADLAAYRPVSSAPATLTAEETALALGTGCVLCPSARADYPSAYEAPRAGAYQAAYTAAAVDVPEPVAFEASPSPEELRRQADLARVERYASYRVADEEPAAFASLEAPAAEDQRGEPPLD